MREARRSNRTSHASVSKLLPAFCQLNYTMLGTAEGLEPSTTGLREFVCLSRWVRVDLCASRLNRVDAAVRTSHTSELLRALPLSYGPVNVTDEMGPTGFEPVTTPFEGFVCSCRWVRTGTSNRLTLHLIAHVSIGSSSARASRTSVLFRRPLNRAKQSGAKDS